MDNIEQKYLDSYRSKGVRTIYDSRKPIITLKYLNKLRSLRDIKNKDLKQRYSLLAVMYGKPSEEGSGF